jgi:hypothetical protein
MDLPYQYLQYTFGYNNTATNHIAQLLCIVLRQWPRLNNRTYPGR